MNSVLPAHLRDKYQNPQKIQKILGESKTIALVGLSADRQRPSHFVATYLQKEGYRIIPVNPKGGEIIGEKCYPDLQSIPQEIDIDIVEVFRPARESVEIAKQAVARKAKTLWLQLRVVSEEAAQIAEAGGLNVIMDKCVKMEHGRYNGSLHWVGMNTEIITAKKAKRLF